MNYEKNGTLYDGDETQLIHFSDAKVIKAVSKNEKDKIMYSLTLF